MRIVEGLAFNDILLLPKFSDLKSRQEVDISVSLSKNFKFALPFTPSNMATVTELKMAQTFHRLGGLAVLHRFCEFSQQLEWLAEIKRWHDGPRHVGFSIGVRESDYSKVDVLVENGAQVIVVDIAHGWSQHCIDMVKYIAEHYKDVLLIAGNVACGEGAAALWKAGADVVKCNIGSGSMCSTRINTGCGVPAISSLLWCHETRQKLSVYLGRELYLMQDGGAVTSGDVAKALVFADIYMGGNIFAGTTEAAGEIVIEDSKQYKFYVGSSTHKSSFKEGVETLKRYKGSVLPIIEQLCEGIRSCCSYNGVRNLADLKKDPSWIKITAAGYAESKPHDYDVLVG